MCAFADRPFLALAAMACLAAGVVGGGCGASAPSGREAMSGSVRAADLFSPDTAGRLMGDDDGRTQRREVSLLDGGPAWRVVIGQVTPLGRKPDAKPARTLDFEPGEHGAVDLRTLIDHRRGTLVRFSPPLRIMPGELAAGRPHETSTVVEAFNLDDPERSVGTGTGVAQARLLETEPGQSRVECFMTFKVSAVRVEQRRTYDVAIDPSGPRIVREAEMLRVRVGPLPIMSESYVWTSRQP
ncbi:MAG: hypothetical protein ACOYPS_05030 [Phycisphaerales bacterium]|jgi:hypothetical protein